MRILIALVATALLAGAAVGFTQPPAQPLPTVEFTVEVLGSKMAEFDAKMDGYLKLRRSLEKGLPALAVTDNPSEIRRAEQLLAQRIRRARAGAGRHDIFTDDTRRAFRQLLRPVTTTATCAFIRDDNPGEFGWAVNSAYPKNQPLSSVPPAMLAVLPQLPEDVFYRFLDTDLFLHDTRANLMLDRIDNAIRCR